MSVETCSHAGRAENHARTSAGASLILKFIKDGLRYDYLSVYFRQDFDMSEQHQIVKGRRVCDDDHAA